MAQARTYVLVVLLVQAVVIAFALGTTGLDTAVPWKQIAVLSALASIALVRAVTGPPR